MICRVQEHVSLGTYPFQLFISLLMLMSRKCWLMKMVIIILELFYWQLLLQVIIKDHIEFLCLSKFWWKYFFITFIYTIHFKNLLFYPNILLSGWSWWTIINLVGRLHFWGIKMKICLFNKYKQFCYLMNLFGKF